MINKLAASAALASDAGRLAQDVISKDRRGSINKVFTDQYRNRTLEDIEENAKAGEKAAKTALKLLRDGRFLKKKLLKVMWLPSEDEILFNIKDETSLSIDSGFYSDIFNNLDIAKWKKLYSKAYNLWLNEDDNCIYDINSQVNKSMVDALIKVNALLSEKVMTFYWFDVDRTNNENFIWEFCPISKKRLLLLGEEYPKINSLISPDYPLVFPRHE